MLVRVQMITAATRAVVRIQAIKASRACGFVYKSSMPFLTAFRSARRFICLILGGKDMRIDLSDAEKEEAFQRLKQGCEQRETENLPLSQDLLDNWEAAKTRVPDYLLLIAQNEDLLDAFLDGVDSVYPGGSIGRALKEKIGYAIAAERDCKFARSEHKIQLKRFDTGITPENDREDAAVDFATQLVEDPKQVNDELFDALQEQFSAAEIVELIFLTGHILTRTMLYDTFGIEPPKLFAMEGDSPFQLAAEVQEQQEEGT